MERFWTKVNRTESCWLWIAGTDGNGYGEFWLHGKMRKAYAVAYELLIGPIPTGTELDHVCRNTLCVRPHSRHVEAVTHRENTLRGISIPATNARKTHCKHGHPFSGSNLILKKSRNRNVSRVCRECKNSQRRLH